jgi:pilus assembly protein CpaE
MSVQQKVLSVKLAVKTPDVLKRLTKIIDGFEGFSLQGSQDAPRVDILVLEIGSNPVSEFETIKALLKEKVVGNLFLTSDKTTSDILLPALRAGAKEFFPQPIDSEEVKAAFQKILSESMEREQAGVEQPSLGKIYSVLGAKGGVGTTTFAVNFATSIQALDKKKLVALVDLNRLVGDVPLFLDLETEINWEDIGKNFSRIDTTYMQSAMVRHSSGVYVMPAPSKLVTERHLPVGFLFKLVKAMRKFFDYIIVDGGMYLDDNLFKIFAESESIYLISILSLPCVINVRKLQDTIYSIEGVSNGKLQIVANRYEKKAQISLAEAGKIIGTDIAITIPNNYQLAMTTVNSGKVFAEVSSKSDVARVYRNIAESVAEPADKSSGTFFSWFRKT